MRSRGNQRGASSATRAASTAIAPVHGLAGEGLRAHAVLMATLDPIITINASGVIQSASDSVLRVLGWQPEHLIGRNINVLMPEPHHSAHDGYLGSYHRTGRTNILNRPRRFDALRKDGTLVPIELCVSRAEVPGGNVLYVGIIRDMSAYAAAERSRDEERVRFEHLLGEQTSALQQANLRLRMADRMASIGTLAAGLGHDMNNVLLPVRARLNALRASADAGNIGRADLKHVDEVRKSVAYLQQLADGLHFLALDPDTEEDVRGGAETDLRQWWGQVGPLLAKSVPKHVRVAAAFGVALPPVAVPAHGLTQAVLNLVVNAGEAFPPARMHKRQQGWVRIWGRVAEEGGDTYVKVGVTDNGVGMSDEVRRRAFEMFYTTKPRGLGTGLGLALVRKVVERAGGSVEIESVEGKGTTVLMRLPVARNGTDNGSNEVKRARVSLTDGRVGAIASHLLQAAGFSLVPDRMETADLWVLDATTAVGDARAWLAKRARRRVILISSDPSNMDDNWRETAFAVVEPEYDALRGTFAHVAQS